MSLKEKLKGSWQNVKKDWKESKEKDRKVKSAFETARHEERIKQAARLGKEGERIRADRRLKELRSGPVTQRRAIGFQQNALFSGGLFGEPAGIRRARKRGVHRKKRGGALYVDGHRIESKPSHRRKVVRKKKAYSPFGDLF